ncbi:MAG: cobaltochelatase subunit CobN, partial [Candidatus Scalindua sp.]|nr:cobaltochelatase subunit CobN [Candidatus Scalindua sp.]
LQVTSLQTIASAQQTKVAVITTPFVLPAKVALLQNIAKAKKITIQGHVINTTDEDAKLWFENADLVVLDTPRGNDRQQTMAFVKDTLASTKTPWIVSGGGPPQGGNLPPKLWRTLIAYYQAGGVSNFTHLMAFIRAWQQGDSTSEIPAPVSLPASGYYHPQAKKHFQVLQDYLTWGQKRWQKDSPVMAIAMSATSISNGQTKVYDYLVEQIEKKGGIPLLFWYDRQSKTAIADKISAANPVMLVNTSHMVGKARQQELEGLAIPVVMALNYRSGTIKQWREAPQGMRGGSYATLMVIPESWGMSDPVVISAIEEGEPAAIPEQVELLIGRFLAMTKLQKANRDELNIALLFWNSPAGEKNFSASNLNVARSIENIIAKLIDQGYELSSLEEKSIIETAQQLLSAYYRHETLDNLLKNDNAEAFPVAKYLTWLNTLPESVSEQVEKTWGKASEHWSVRSINGEAHFIIPRAKLGKFIFLPQPPRADELGESTHDLVQPPGHFYLAAYLYLREQFNADAIIHLGTHGSQEWTPGKDRGLSAYDYPNLTVGNVPVFYPYIQDNIGEAMQTKRRGRATVISHQTPPFAPSGFYDELTDIHDLMHEYLQLETGAVRDETLKAMVEHVVKANLHKDLGWTEVNIQHKSGEFISVLHDHLHLLAQAATPIGLHTFGESASEPYRIATIMQQLGSEYYQALDLDSQEMFAQDIEALFETPAFLHLQSFIQGHKKPEQATSASLSEFMETAITNNQRLVNNNELAALMIGLKGKFILPGSGGDPVRSPDTSSGTNLYALNPDKVPSPAAYKAAKGTLEQLLADYRKNNEGQWPDKLAFSLWSSETIRTLGLSEAQIMHAIGVRPVWGRGGYITELEIIPQAEMDHPRVDVLLQATSVYRDQFDGIMRKMAQSIEDISQLKEKDNVIAQNSLNLALSLQEKGMDLAKAKRYAEIRIFSNPPGSYGSGVTPVAMDSTSWEDDTILADTFINSQSHIYGTQDWGTPVHDIKLMESQLDGVDAVILSRSSNLHGLLSTDHPFEYLGGLSASVKKVTGENPKLYISNARSKEAVITSAESFLSNELRTRYQNPQWIKGMQKEGYAGTVQILKIVNNLFGWQVMDTNMVREDQWQSMHETYVMDKRDLKLNEWFAKHNATAQAQLVERMVEAIRKDYWDAPEQTRRELIQRWQALVNEHGAQAGAAKTVEFMKGQAAGFGMSWSLPTDASQSAEAAPVNESAQSQQVQGQVLEEVEVNEQVDQPNWMIIFGWLLLFLCILFGVLTSLHQQRKIKKYQSKYK